MSTSESAAFAAVAAAPRVPRHPRLARPFRVIAFDWSGTAVGNRREDATPIRTRLEALLELGVWAIIITGTNFPNVDRQLTSAIHGLHKQRLLVCANRGSEVYGFDVYSRPVLLWRRTATPEEDQRLTAIAQRVRDALAARTGLSFAVVYDRLNRRKIDLLPLQEWEDTPKAALAETLATVEARLRGAGLEGGLAEALALAQGTAADLGLPNACMTSDGKYLEVGLTDKADAMAWVLRHVVGAEGIAPADVLVVGDEFGPLGGRSGSDARMMVPALEGATFVSVGPEPGGVPAGVLHLGGGPATFRALLERQVVRHQLALRDQEHDLAAVRALLLPPTDHRWLLEEEGFTPAREHEIESLFTVANGYLATRGSLEEGSPASAPATFVAGVFDQAPGALTVPELVVTPAWTQVRVQVEGEDLALDQGEVLEHRRILDLKRGLLLREWHHQDPNGRITRLRFLRFASLSERHLAVQALEVTPENYTGRVQVEAVTDGRVSNDGGVVHLVPTAGEYAGTSAPASTETRSRWGGQAGESTRGEPASVRGEPVEPPNERPSTSSGRTEFSPPVPNLFAPERPVAATAGTGHNGHSSQEPGAPTLVLQTRTSGITVAQSSAGRLLGVAAAHYTASATPAELRETWAWDAELDRSCLITRVTAVYTSREAADPAAAAANHCARQGERGLAALLSDHERAWAERWAASDVEVHGDEIAQRALRFGVYHLISAANPADERVSIGARALTGQAYRGHVFWDTDIFMLPFYIYTWPEAARALLMYRYHTLAAARAKAQSCGYRGALYAWESADTGEETTPALAITPSGEIIPIVAGTQEQHITADVAYAVWQYWQATGDEAFFLRAGAEMVLEAARFWASRATPGEDGRYHIRAVQGPDEYHEGVDDNAYTNVMARWTLERGRDTVSLLRQRWPQTWDALVHGLGLRAEELETWQRVAGGLAVGYRPGRGVALHPPAPASQAWEAGEEAQGQLRPLPSLGGGRRSAATAGEGQANSPSRNPGGEGGKTLQQPASGEYGGETGSRPAPTDAAWRDARLIEQFSGYFDLEDIDLAAFEPRTAPMDVLLGRERTQQSQVVKQADVVMLLHLLWDDFPPAVRRANFRYYEPRSGHGSSLSPAIHAAVAARLDDLDLARRYCHQAAAIDLANNMGNAAGGVHAGAVGGLWQAAACGVLGLGLRGDDGLTLEPRLLPGWHGLEVPVQWRGRRLRLTLQGEPLTLEVVVAGKGPVPIWLDGRRTALASGKRYRTQRRDGVWQPWEEVGDARLSLLA